MAQDIDQLCDQHDPHPLDRRDPEGELGPPGDADGAGAGRLHALAAPPALRPGRPDLAQPRPLRALGRPRLDAALLAALPRRGEGGRPRLRGRRRARPCSLARHRKLPPARLARARATPSTAGPPASRRPPGRSARAIATSVGMAIASKWQGAPLRRRALRLRRLRDRRRRLPDGGRLARSRLARRPPQARQPLLDLRQQPHHDRRRTPTSPTTTTSPPASRATAGTCIRVGDANDAELLARAFEEFKAEDGPPDPDHRRQPHRLGLAAQAGHRRRPRRAARRGGGASRPSAPTAGPRTPSSSSPTASASTSPTGIGKRGAELRAAWEAEARRATRADADLAAEIETMQQRELPDGWDAAIPTFEADEEGASPPARPRTRSRTRSPSGCPGCSPAPPTSPTRPRSGSTSTAPPTSSPAASTAASSTSGSASTSRRRSATASRSRKLRPLWSTYLTFSDYAPPGDPPLGADGAAGDPPLHPRLDRARRGRPDPPADRAARLAAGDARAST